MLITKSAGILKHLLNLSLCSVIWLQLLLNMFILCIAFIAPILLCFTLKHGFSGVVVSTPISQTELRNVCITLL